MQSQDQKKITIKINIGTENEAAIDFSLNLLKFNVPFLEGNHEQHYPIPPNIASRLFPLNFMKLFVEAHDYDPASYKINKPLKTSNFQNIVDKKTFDLCQKYTDLTNAEEAEEIIGLANYLNFQMLEEAVSAALAVNYYVGNDEKQIDNFIKVNRLDQMTPNQITAIIEEHKDIYDLIEEKQKEKALNEGQ